MPLEDQIITIIQENIEKKDIVITKNTRLENLELDSFGLLMLINAFEDYFKINLNTDHFTQLATVADIIESLRNFQEDK